MPDSLRFVQALARQIDGTVYTDQAVLQTASVDFGQVLCKTPKAVVRPAHTGDVATLLRYAQTEGCTVSIRGAGHSQGGQSLNEGGIVLDTRGLDKIEAPNRQEGWVLAGAGALWSTLVRTVAADRLLPPVLTDHTQVTIGGTLAVGGVGPASFCQGLQLHHTLGAEVVLGTGETVWASPEQEPDLFAAVLGSLGHFGIITKAKLRLHPFRRYVQTVRLSYDNLTSFLHDAHCLMQLPQVHGLEGFARPSVKSAGASPRTKHRYILEVSSASDESRMQPPPWLEGAGRAKQQRIVKRTTLAYLFRLEQSFTGYGRPVERERARPWVEHFLPLAAVEEYVESIAASFPTTTFLLWPMLTARLHQPMVALPPVSDVVLVGILASIPPAALPETLPLLQQANELGMALGGKRYLSGWLPFDRAQWQQHYGPALWEEIRRRKQRCDPHRVLQGLPGVGIDRTE